MAYHVSTFTELTRRITGTAHSFRELQVTYEVNLSFLYDIGVGIRI